MTCVLHQMYYLRCIELLTYRTLNGVAVSGFSFTDAAIRTTPLKTSGLSIAALIATVPPCQRKHGTSVFTMFTSMKKPEMEPNYMIVGQIRLFISANKFDAMMLHWYFLLIFGGLYSWYYSCCNSKGTPN